MARAAAALCALLAAVAGVAGCGEEDGVGDGAVVTAYAEESVCGNLGAFSALVQTQAGETLPLKVFCLPDARGAALGQGVGGGTQVDLARAGANARRASQDSRTVAYLEAPDPAVGRFTHPILEAAGIGWLSTEATGMRALRELSDLVAQSGSSSVRADVREALGQG